MQEYNDEMEKYWAARDKMTGKSPMPRPQIPQLPKLPEMPALPESPPLSESPELPELNTQYPDPSAWSSPGSQESRIPPINPYAARRPYSTDRNPPAAPGTQSSLGNDRYRTGPDEAETAAESQASFLESCYPTGNIGGSRSWDVNDTPDCKMYDFNLYMDKHQISFKSCSRANICYIKCPMNSG
ncbi:MAG: hypothetical protein M1815_005459 [Lichina confinis]|nr:MAG: hypothetical protein M1815_005459 [Lichina confinis]